MTLDKNETDAIDAYLKRRDQMFASEQKLVIREEIEKCLRQHANDRRSTLQLIGALGGVSILALGGLLYTNIEETAKRAASSAVEGSVEKLDTAAEQIEDIRAQAGNTAILINDARIEVRQLIAEVELALGQVKAAEGGVGVASQLVQIIRDLEEIKVQMPQPENASAEIDGAQPLGDRFQGQDK